MTQPTESVPPRQCQPTFGTGSLAGKRLHWGDPCRANPGPSQPDTGPRTTLEASARGQPPPRQARAGGA
eukprot:6025192-Pyramimonas_sp.AAC.1